MLSRVCCPPNERWESKPKNREEGSGADQSHHGTLSTTSLPRSGERLRQRHSATCVKTTPVPFLLWNQRRSEKPPRKANPENIGCRTHLCPNSFCLSLDEYAMSQSSVILGSTRFHLSRSSLSLHCAESHWIGWCRCPLALAIADGAWPGPSWWLEYCHSLTTD